MTEETIIDGINVSECKYYHNEYPNDDCAISGHCEAYGDCTYKNLQLRKQFRNLQVQYEKVVEQNKSLQAELREKTAECGELKKAFLVLAEGLNFRQKILDEIENFAKRHCNTCEDNGQQLCSSNYCYRHYLLDIISKAKDGEE